MALAVVSAVGSDRIDDGEIVGESLRLEPVTASTVSSGIVLGRPRGQSRPGPADAHGLHRGPGQPHCRTQCPRIGRHGVAEGSIPVSEVWVTGPRETDS